MKELDILGKFLAEDNIRIRYEDNACPAASIFYKEIILPSNIKVTDDLIAALFHEAAHILHTKHEGMIDRLNHACLNALEDIRIDLKNFERFANLKDNFHRRFAIAAYEKNKDTCIDNADMFIFKVLSNLIFEYENLNLQYTDKQVINFLDDYKEYIDDIIKEFIDLDDLDIERVSYLAAELAKLLDLQIRHNNIPEPVPVLSEYNQQQLDLNKQVVEQKQKRIEHLNKQVDKLKNKKHADADADADADDAIDQQIEAKQKQIDKTTAEKEKTEEKIEVLKKNRVSSPIPGMFGLKDIAKSAIEIEETLEIKSKENLISLLQKLKSEDSQSSHTKINTSKLHTFRYSDECLNTRHKRHFNRKIAFLLDVSGSMSVAGLKIEKSAMQSISKILDDFDIEHAICAFGSFVTRIKEFDKMADWRTFEGGMGTDIILALETAQGMLEDVSSEDKDVIICATDGALEQKQIEYIKNFSSHKLVLIGILIRVGYTGYDLLKNYNVTELNEFENVLGRALFDALTS